MPFEVKGVVSGAQIPQREGIAGKRSDPELDALAARVRMETTKETFLAVQLETPARANTLAGNMRTRGLTAYVRGSQCFISRRPFVKGSKNGNAPL